MIEKIAYYIKGKNSSLLLIFLFLYSILVLVFFIVRSRLDIQSHAASSQGVAIEPESAVLSGPVSIGNDANASNGQYIQFNAPPTPTATPTPTLTSTPTPPQQLVVS